MNRKELETKVGDQTKEIEDLQGQVLELTIQLEKSSSTGRKSQVLELLKKSKSVSIIEIAEHCNISTKNVSSQLTYLRSDGYQIFTDPKGRKVLVEQSITSQDKETPDKEMEDMEGKDLDNVKDDDDEVDDVVNYDDV